jgi:hypothetical protein
MSGPTRSHYRWICNCSSPCAHQGRKHLCFVYMRKKKCFRTKCAMRRHTSSNGIANELTRSVLISRLDMPIIRICMSAIRRATRLTKLTMVPNCRDTLLLRIRGGDTFESSESVALSREVKPRKPTETPTKNCRVPSIQSYIVSLTCSSDSVNKLCNWKASLITDP